MKEIGRTAAKGSGRILLAMALLVLMAAATLAIGSGVFKAELNSNQPVPAAPFLGPAPRLRTALSHLPLVFEPNQGQADRRVQFLAHGLGYGLFFTAHDAVLSLQTTRPHAPVIHMAMDAANPAAVVSGADQLAGKSNYLIGNNPARWHRDVPHFARVRYHEIYPGVDLVYYGTQGRLEYDFEIAPGADPSQIALRFDRSQVLTVSRDGALVLAAGDANVRFEAPHAYQTIAAEQRPVSSRFVLRGDDRVAFELGPYDRTRTLIIDPVLSYSTYLGGTGAEACSAIAGSGTPIPGCPAIAVDSAFNIYIAGATTSTDFPLTPPPVSPATGPLPFQPCLDHPGTPVPCPNDLSTSDVFVTKLNSTGSGILFSTYVGGAGTDFPAGLAVDAGFNVFVAGTTNSSDFPTSSSAFQQTPRTAGTHAFLVQLKSDGSALSYSTYLSGNGTDTASGVALDVKGKAYVIGTTTSTDQPSTTTVFPATLGALQTASLATNQFFVSKIDPILSGNASLPFSTYFGGGNPASGAAAGGAIALDTNSNVYITGTTNFLHVGNASTDFPILNAFQGCLNTTATPPPSPCPSTSATDAFIAKINPAAASGAQLIYSSYLGGSGADTGTGVAVDSGGTAYVTGSTASTDFVLPTGTTAFQGSNAGGTDAFVAKVGSSLNTTSNSFPLNYFTYLGGTGTDVATAIAVDSSQGAHITGWTTSGDFHTQNPVQSSLGGGTDAFVARIDTTAASATAIGHFSSFLGGSGNDAGTGIAVDSQGATYVAGETASGNFPTAHPLQAALSGPSDAFISKLGPSINLAITATPSPATAIGVGNQISFTYKITNNGDQVTGVTFTDTLPSSGATAGATPSNCAPPSGNLLVCNLGTINAGGSVSITVSLTPSAGGAISNSAQISVPGSTFSASASASVPVVDYAVAATPASVTVQAGVPATYTVAVTPTGAFPNAVSLSVTGLPSGGSASFTNGSSISNLQNGPQSRQLVIATTARTTTTGALQRQGGPLYAAWLPVSGLALLGVGFSGKRSRGQRLLLLLLLAGLLSMIVFQGACGYSAPSNPITNGTPAGTYTLNVSATSGTVSRTTAVTLVVQ